VPKHGTATVVPAGLRPASVHRNGQARADRSSQPSKPRSRLKVSVARGDARRAVLAHLSHYNHDASTFDTRIPNMPRNPHEPSSRHRPRGMNPRVRLSGNLTRTTVRW
jgi:hypothetical protein